MAKRAQGLPMQVVALIIIVIIVIAAVVIFFYGTFGSSKSGMDSQVDFGECYRYCQIAETSGSSTLFCANDCDEMMECRIGGVVIVCPS